MTESLGTRYAVRGGSGLRSEDDGSGPALGTVG
jgi:hypothetical protein